LLVQVRNAIHCTDLEGDGASEVEYYLTLLEDNDIAAQDGGIFTKGTSGNSSSSRLAATSSGGATLLGGEDYAKTSPAPPARSTRVGPIA
jgi:hypothetical protein